MSKHKNDEIIKELFAKFDLNVDEDYFEKEGQYKIITRKGIDKIIAQSDSVIEWKTVYTSDFMVVIEAWARKFDKDGKVIFEWHTNGEADRDNVKLAPKYVASMALARAKSRAVLGVEGLYKYGVYSADEAEEFLDFTKGKQGGGGSSRLSLPKIGANV